MSTYEQLRDKALRLTDQVGATDATRVAEVALEEALNYVSTKVVLDGLRGRATYTWLSTDVTVPVGGGGFAITDLSTPLHLYVGAAQDDGTRYDYRRWNTWLTLKFSPSQERLGLFEPTTYNELPDRCFTIDPDNNIHIYPEPSEDQILTLYYEKDPAGYGDGTGTPEITGKYQSILTMGAVLWIKDWLREPDQSINPYLLFEQLDPQIRELEIHLRSNGQRPKVKLNRSVFAC